MQNDVITMPPVAIDARRLLDCVHDPVLIFDPDGEIVLDVNERACVCYGFAREEFIGMSLLAMSKRADVAARHLRATLSTNSYYSFDTVQLRRDGTEMLLEVHALPVTWSGRPAILSINHDITGRVRMLHHLEDTAAEWQLTVDALHAALVLVDARGRITRANVSAAQSVAAAGFAQIIGRHLSDLAHHAPWDRVTELVEKALQSRQPATVQVTDRASRQTWDIGVTLTPCPDEEPQAVVIIRDVTRNHELEAMLRRNENMAAVGRLVAGVAHEVRNPLFIISASLEALMSRCAEGDETERQLRANLQHEVRRLTLLMNDLLDYAKPAALEAVPESIDRLLGEAIRSVSVHAAERKVRIDNVFPAGTRELLVDPLRLSQAFHNLLHNAIHYSPPGGVITIGGHEDRRGDDEWIICTIDDNGPGFPTGDLGSLFEPFFSRRPGGTGLGLSIVHRTIELHGGRITASNRPRGGARMTVELPRFS